jgi:putative iron-dependent peroxidase
MASPQTGIFALGTSSHAYLELDAADDAAALVAAVASLREPRTTMGGVNLVAGFRPELWRKLRPEDTPSDAAGFDADLAGIGGFVMPATQHDAVLWISGGSYDVVFDVGRAAIAALHGLATVGDETSSWSYHHDLDLTGFIDGTENPTLVEAQQVVAVPEGSPGAGASVLLLQKWQHDAVAWESLGVERQEKVIGRTKPDSIELDPRPDDSHVASTDQDTFGTILRRNMAYGTVTDHGTMFVGFAASRGPLQKMLESMAGLKSGARDALTNYTKPVTGAYYVVPSIESIASLGGAALID